MKCPKCDKVIKDENCSVCPKCGEKIKNDFFINFRNNKKKLFISIGCGIVLICLIILFLFNVFSAKSIANKYFNGLKTYNVEKVIKTFHPNYVKVMEDYLNMNYEDYVHETFNSYKTDKYKLTKYKIGKYKKYSQSELDSFKDTLVGYGISGDQITEVREYNVKITISDDGNKETSDETVILVKIDKKWYVFGGV